MRLLIASLLLALVCGCDSPSEGPQRATNAPQGKVTMQADTQAKEPALYARVVERKGPETTMQGPEIHQKRRTTIIREFSGFGLGAGEVVSNQKPMTVSQGPAPGFQVNAAGVQVQKETASDEMSTGGFKQSWLSKVWVWLKDGFFNILIIGAIIIGVLFVLPVFVPALAPLATGFISLVGRFFAAAIPFVGSLVEKIIASFKLKQANQQIQTEQTQKAQIVNGGDLFRETLSKDASLGLTDAQKTGIDAMFIACHKQEQDKITQSQVKAIQNK